MSAAAVEETITGEQLEQLSARVRELAGDVAQLEAGRRHPMSGRELVNHETRLSTKRRQLHEAETELDQLAAAAQQAAEAERAARELDLAAARPKLERRRTRLQTKLTRQLLEIERLAPELAAAVHAALAADRDLAGVEHELGLRRFGSSRSSWPSAIENRLGFLLCGDLGPVGEITRPLGLGGRDPLASVSTCSVCRLSPRKLNQLEAALASGTSLGRAAKDFGVSSAALSRHRQHGGR